MNRSIISYINEIDLGPNIHKAYNKVVPKGFENKTMKRYTNKINPYLNTARITNAVKTATTVGGKYIMNGGPFKSLSGSLLGLATIPQVMKKMAQGGDVMASKGTGYKPSL